MVCHAAPCSPSLGPAKRHLHPFEELTRKHVVSVVSLADPGDQQRFETQHMGRYCRAIFIPKRSRTRIRLRILRQLLTGHSQIRHARDLRVQRAIDAILAAERIDALYISTVLHGDYSWPTTIPAIGDAHNIEYEVFRRMARVAAGPWWRTTTPCSRRSRNVMNGAWPRASVPSGPHRSVTPRISRRSAATARSSSFQTAFGSPMRE